MKLLKASRVRRYVARLDTQGKHGRPATIARVRDEPYALIRLPLESLDVIEPADRARIDRYASLPTPLPPVLAQYSDRSCRRGVDQVFVWNGNHRVAAAKQRGQRSILVLIPRSDLQRWRSCKR